jgi:hypothetical protein
MTDETAFVAMLDKNPDDHVTRDLFAEWCEDTGDPRAPGLRWLASNRKRPTFTKRSWEDPKPWWWNRWNDDDTKDDEWSVIGKASANCLPRNLWRAMGGRPDVGDCVEFPTRQAAENAFCKAYLAVQSAADELRRVRGEIAEMLHVPAKPTGKFIPPGSFEAAVGQLGRLKLKEASLRDICGEPETEAATT